jgi:predicted metal-dependent hydrolase
MQVEVVRSKKRRKTISAHQVNGVLRVSIPATMTRAEEEHWVGEMVRRMERRSVTSEVDLAERAAVLAGRYRLPTPASIRWVGNQAGRWGSCSPHDRSVRISDRLAGYPGWVVDYVIIHELAHLVEAHHNARFYELVNRYPKAERATGFLMAKGMDDGADPEGEAVGEGSDGQ